MQLRLGVIAFSIVVVSPVSGSAQMNAEITYRHYDDCRNVLPRQEGCTAGYERRLEPGGTLTVWVKRTRAEMFDIDVRGYTVREMTGEGDRPRNLGDESLRRWGTEPNDSVAVQLTHNAKYGGYAVTITPKEPLRADGQEITLSDGTKLDAKVPGSALLLVRIDAEEPRYSFSGGVSLTTLRDPGFVARATPTAGSFTIVEEDGRRDDATVGLATFVNLRPFENVGWFWPGLGIGLETGGNTQYYFGLGLRLTRGIFLNLGGTLGRVAMLPAGVRVNDTITDPNQMSNLPRRNALGLFGGLSFAFLGGGQQAFGRPFAGAET